MEKSGIIYKIKTATVKEILAHLKECNNNFSPPLAERVNVDAYSRKLYEKSVTFEAWEGRCLAGLLAAYFNDSTDCSVFITNVSVLKDFMGLGIASELLRECIEYAIKENFREIKLEVNKENSYAIGLYRKFDFIIDGISDSFLKMKMELIKAR
jgi:ribosomal protein S18 acetylase RimI-like enzyme